MAVRLFGVLAGFGGTAIGTWRRGDGCHKSERFVEHQSDRISSGPAPALRFRAVEDTVAFDVGAAGLHGCSCNHSTRSLDALIQPAHTRISWGMLCKIWPK